MGNKIKSNKSINVVIYYNYVTFLNFNVLILYGLHTLANLFMNLIIIIIIIIKRDWQCKAGRERSTPYQSEDPNPTTPTHWKKEEKGKTVGDKKGASS